MTTCAIVLKSRRDAVEGILMLLDEREEAEDVAFELRRRGQDVEVVEMEHGASYQ